MRNRPDWDTHWLRIAAVHASRSPDEETQHGCVIVDDRQCVLAMGYNGFPSNVNDAALPARRPDKYDFMVHAEANAIARCGRSLVGAKAYVTGLPCSRCMTLLNQAGIVCVIYGPVESVMQDAEDRQLSHDIARMCSIVLKPHTM